MLNTYVTSKNTDKTHKCNSVVCIFIIQSYDNTENVSTFVCPNNTHYIVSYSSHSVSKMLMILLGWGKKHFVGGSIRMLQLPNTHTNINIRNDLKSRSFLCLRTALFCVMRVLLVAPHNVLTGGCKESIKTWKNIKIIRQFWLQYHQFL